MSDWFRKRSWTPEDQADFWRRHRRCRSDYDRAQFLSIQAFHLAETRQRELMEAAMKLLNLMIAEFPEPSQLSCAHVERGDIFLQRGRVDEALAEYRKAIAQERVHPEARTQCWLSFGWTAVMHHRTELYHEAERILSEREAEAMFPVNFYRLHAIRSIICQSRGDINTARAHAEAALREASKTHSGFRYHPNLGLVTSYNGDIRRLLEEVLND